MELLHNVYNALFGQQQLDIVCDKGLIAILRPEGCVVLIDDIQFDELNVYGVIYITGEKRGNKDYIRKRNIIRTRKVETNDIYHYRLCEIVDDKDKHLFL